MSTDWSGSDPWSKTTVSSAWPARRAKTNAEVAESTSHSHDSHDAVVEEAGVRVAQGQRPNAEAPLASGAAVPEGHAGGMGMHVDASLEVVAEEGRAPRLQATVLTGEA